MYAIGRRTPTRIWSAACCWAALPSSAPRAGQFCSLRRLCAAAPLPCPRDTRARRRGSLPGRAGLARALPRLGRFRGAGVRVRLRRRAPDACEARALPPRHAFPRGAAIWSAAAAMNSRRWAGSTCCFRSSRRTLAASPPAAAGRPCARSACAGCSNTWRPTVRASLLLDELAGREGLSVSYLSHFFRDNLTRTFQDYLAGLRCERARRLLAEPGCSLLDASVGSAFPTSNT